MRVTLLAPIYAPYRTPVLRDLAKLCDLHVILSAPTEHNRHWRLPDELPFRCSVISGAGMRIGHRTLYPSPRIVARLRTNRPDVIIASGYAFATFYCFLYGAATGVPVCVWSEGTAHSERGVRGLSHVTRRLAVRMADAYIGTSSQAVLRFQELGATPSACFRVPYALDVPDMPRAQPPRDGICRMLVLGQLIPRKGLSELLDALAVARQRTPGRLTATIAGEGPMRRAIEQKIATCGLGDVVSLVGHIDPAGLPDLYRSHNVLVFPSLSDSFGVVPLEAMRAGLPVIASKYAAVADDFVEDGVTGRVIDPRDSSQFVAALLEAAAWPSWMDAAGATAIMRMEEASPGAAATTLLTAATQAVSRSQARPRRLRQIG